MARTYWKLALLAAVAWLAYEAGRELGKWVTR